MADERRVDGPERSYRAIGRFIFEFSQFVGNMEAGLVMFAAPGRSDAGIAWRTGLTGIEAYRMMTLFFGVSSSMIDLTETERKIRDKLFASGQALIEERNRLAHGVWYLARTEGAARPGMTSRLSSTPGSHRRWGSSRSARSSPSRNSSSSQTARGTSPGWYGTMPRDATVPLLHGPEWKTG